MTRLHADPVEVRRADHGHGLDPAQFLWRGRRYAVREVLARWTESGQWWRTPAVRALTSGEAAGGSAALPGLSVDDGERSWWRVEAGRAAARSLEPGTGVYDLCLSEADGTWALVRVLD